MWLKKGVSKPAACKWPLRPFLNALALRSRRGLKELCWGSGALWTPWGWDIPSPGSWVRRDRCPATCAGRAGGRGFALLESCQHKLTAGLPPAPLLAELGSGNPRPRREEELTYNFFPFLLSSRCVGCGLPSAYGLEPGQKPTACSSGPSSPGLGTGAMSRRCLCPGPAAVSPCPQQRPRPGAVGADGASRPAWRAQVVTRGAAPRLFPLCHDNRKVTSEGLLKAFYIFFFPVSRLEIKEEFHPVGHEQLDPYQRDGEGNWRELISLRKNQM